MDKFRLRESLSFDGMTTAKGNFDISDAAAVELAFHGLNLHRVEASIMPRNAASLALARRCGFVEVGRSPRYICINGVWEDHIHMARLNEE